MSAIDPNKAAIESYEKGFKIGPGSSTRWGRAVEAIGTLANENKLNIIETDHLLDILSRMKKDMPHSSYINAIEHNLVQRFNRLDPNNEELIQTSRLFQNALNKDHHLLEEVGGTQCIKVAYLLTNPSLLKKEPIVGYFTRKEIEDMQPEDVIKVISMLAAQPFGEEQIRKFVIVKEEGADLSESYLNEILPHVLDERIDQIDSQHLLTPLEEKYLTPEQLGKAIGKLIPLKGGDKLIRGMIQNRLNQGGDRKPLLIAIAKAAENRASKGMQDFNLIAASTLYHYRGEIKPFEAPGHLAPLVFQEAIRNDKGLASETHLWLSWALANNQNSLVQNYLAARCSPLLNKEELKAILFPLKESRLQDLPADMRNLIEKQEGIALERFRSTIVTDQRRRPLTDYLSEKQIKALTQEQIDVLVPAIGSRQDGVKALMSLYKLASLSQQKLILTRLVTATAALIDRGSTDKLTIINLATTLKELYRTYKEPTLLSTLQIAFRRGYQAAKRELSGSYQSFFLEQLSSALPGKNAFKYLPFFLFGVETKGDAYAEFVERAPLNKTPPIQVKNHIKALYELHQDNKIKNPVQVTMNVLDFARKQNGYTPSRVDPINFFPPGREWVLVALTSKEGKCREQAVQLLKKAIGGDKPDRTLLNHLFKRDVTSINSWEELLPLVDQNQGSLKKQLEPPSDTEAKVGWCKRNIDKSITQQLTPQELTFISSDDAISLAYIACCQANGSKDLITLYRARDGLDRKNLECYLISNLVEYLKEPSPERDTVYKNTIAVLKEAYGSDFTTTLLSRFTEMYPDEDPFPLLFNFLKPNSYAHPQPLAFFSTAPLEKTPPECLFEHLLNMWVEYRGRPFEDINIPLNRVLDFSLQQKSYQKMGEDPYDIMPPTKIWLMQALISDDKAIQDKAILLLNKAFNPSNGNGPIPSQLVESLTGIATTGQTWSQLKGILTSSDANRRMALKLHEGLEDFRRHFR